MYKNIPIAMTAIKANIESRAKARITSRKSSPDSPTVQVDNISVDDPGIIEFLSSSSERAANVLMQEPNIVTQINSINICFFIISKSY